MGAIDFCNETDRINLKTLFQSAERDIDIKPLYTYLCPMIMIICFLSIMFNAVLINISRQSKVVNKSPILLLSLNLAVTDLTASLLNGLNILFNSYLPEVHNIKMGQCSMLIIEVIRCAALVASALHLLALAFVHYRGIVNPLHYRSTIFFSQHLSRTINIITLACWIIPLTIMIVWFSSSPCQGFQSAECDYLFLLGFTFRYMILTLFALPLLLMSAIYLRIFIIISRHQKGRRMNHERSTLTRGIVSASGTIGTAAAPMNLPELIAKKGVSNDDDNDNNNNNSNLDDDDDEFNNNFVTTNRGGSNEINLISTTRCAACAARALHDEDDPTISLFGEPTIEAEAGEIEDEEGKEINSKRANEKNEEEEANIEKKVCDIKGVDISDADGVANDNYLERQMIKNKSSKNDLEGKQQDHQTITGDFGEESLKKNVEQISAVEQRIKINKSGQLSLNLAQSKKVLPAPPISNKNRAIRLQSNLLTKSNNEHTAYEWECTCDNKYNLSNNNNVQQKQVKLSRSNTVGDTSSTSGTMPIVRKLNINALDNDNSKNIDNNTRIKTQTNDTNNDRPPPLTPVNMVTVSIASQRSSISSAVAPSSLRSHFRRSPTSQSATHSVQTDYRSNQTFNVTSTYSNHQHHHDHQNYNDYNNNSKFPFISNNRNSSSTYEPQRRHIHASAVPQTNTKALVTTLLILGTYFISYVPAIIMQVLTCVDYCPYPLYDISFSKRIVFASVTTFLLIIKSIIDPFIYSYRMSEIQVAVNRYISKRRSKTTSSMHVTNQRLTMSLHHNSNNNNNNLTNNAGNNNNNQQNSNNQQNDTNITSSFKILNNKNNNNNNKAGLRTTLSSLKTSNRQQTGIQSWSFDIDNSNRTNFIGPILAYHQSKPNNYTRQEQQESSELREKLIEKDKQYDKHDQQQQTFDHLKSDSDGENKSNCNSSSGSKKIIDNNSKTKHKKQFHASSEDEELIKNVDGKKNNIINFNDVKDKAKIEKKVIKVFKDAPDISNNSDNLVIEHQKVEKSNPITIIKSSPTNIIICNNNSEKKYSVGMILNENQNVGLSSFNKLQRQEMSSIKINDSILIDEQEESYHKRNRHKHKHHHNHHHHQHRRHTDINNANDGLDYSDTITSTISNNHSNDNSQTQHQIINSSTSSKNLIC